MLNISYTKIVILPVSCMYLRVSLNEENIYTYTFFCEHSKKYRNFTQSLGTEILRQQTVSADPREICPKIYGNCPPTEILHTRKSEKIPGLYSVEVTFAIIYSCLLFSTGLNFSIKYVSYDSLKILLSSWIAKKDKIRKYPPPHILIWPSTYICCNSGCGKCCL